MCSPWGPASARPGGVGPGAAFRIVFCTVASEAFMCIALTGPGRPRRTASARRCSLLSSDDAAAAARLSARTSPVAPTTPAVRRPGQQVQVQPRGVRVEGDADPQKRREQRRRPGRGCCDGPPFYWKKPFGDARSGRHRRAPSSGDGPCAHKSPRLCEVDGNAVRSALAHDFQRVGDIPTGFIGDHGHR